MRTFQIDDGTVYSSFLNCLNDRKFTTEDLNMSAVSEFLIYGQLHGEDTFLERVTKSFTHQRYQFDCEKGLIESTIDSINPLQKRPFSSLKNDQKRFLSFFEDRADHLRGKKISIDLTGGIDSRLIASVLYALDVKYDAMFSMISGDENELKIVQHLCNTLNVDLHIIREESLMDEKEFEALYELSDGIWNPLKIRSLAKAQSWRKGQNYDLVITGVAGELYKDFFWQQDFPFYTSKKHHFERLNRLRMYPSMIAEKWIGEKLREEYTTFQKKFISGLKSHKKQLNTQTYDQIYYNIRVKETSSALSKMSSSYLPVYSPLLDPELLRIGYNLKRRHRFFNNFHRSVITYCTPEIASVPTTEGEISVSMNGSDLFRDVFKYGANKSKTLLSKLTDKRITPINSENKHKKLSAIIERSIKNLKQVGILSKEAPESASSYPDGIVGRLLLLSKFTESLDKQEL